ncbi:MAG: hypothetical protein AB7V16_11400 [Vulcanibacillus sp.]
MMNYELKVGNDNGNSEHDIIINGDIIQQNNVYAVTNKIPNLEELNKEHFIRNIHDNLIVTIESKALNNGLPETYFVSNYAMKSGRMLRNIEVGAINSKLNSNVPITNTVSHIAGYIIKKAFFSDDIHKQLNTKVDMTTALPVNQYSKANAKEFSQRYMEHPFYVTVHVPGDQYKVNVEFSYVKTLPEAVPAVFFLQNANKEQSIVIYKKDLNGVVRPQKLPYIFDLLNNEFQGFYKDKKIVFDNDFFKNKSILHTAIGEGTTENPKTDDINFDPNFIEGANVGVGHAIKEVLNTFITNKHLLKFSRQDFSNLLKDPSHKYHDEAMELIEIPLIEQAELIFRNTIDEISKANNNIDINMVHGGGSILMRNYLQPKLLEFCNSIGSIMLYIPEEYAVILEALGLYAFTNSTLFEQLKKNHEKVTA